MTTNTHDPEKPVIKPLEVDFYDSKSGFIYFRVRSGNQTFEGFFMEVFDPIWSFKHWLEAVSTYVQQTSFWFDMMHHVRFNLQQGNSCMVLTISQDTTYKPEIYIKAPVDRKQMVRAFYEGFVSFLGSNRYISECWEHTTLKDRFCRILHMEEKELMTCLLKMNRRMLTTYFSFVNSGYFFMYPDHESALGEYWRAFRLAFEGHGILPPEMNEKMTNFFFYSEDYDGLPPDQKHDILMENLDIKVNYYNGTPAEDFYSDWIEKFLEEDEPD